MFLTNLETALKVKKVTYKDFNLDICLIRLAKVFNILNIF